MTCSPSPPLPSFPEAGMHVTLDVYYVCPFSAPPPHLPPHSFTPCPRSQLKLSAKWFHPTLRSKCTSALSEYPPHYPSLLSVPVHSFVIRAFQRPLRVALIGSSCKLYRVARKPQSNLLLSLVWAAGTCGWDRTRWTGAGNLLLILLSCGEFTETNVTMGVLSCSIYIVKTLGLRRAIVAAGGGGGRGERRGVVSECPIVVGSVTHVDQSAFAYEVR